MYDALTIVNYLEELISKLSTITVICAIVGVGTHSITVGVYRKQKDRKLKNKNQRNFDVNPKW